jgi:hypothetical protein
MSAAMYRSHNSTNIIATLFIGLVTIEGLKGKVDPVLNESSTWP